MELFGRFGTKDLIAAVAGVRGAARDKEFANIGAIAQENAGRRHPFGEKTLLSATQIDELLQMCRVALLESLRRQCRHQPSAILVRSADKFVRPLTR
jgi:hypothetical protein